MATDFQPATSRAELVNLSVDESLIVQFNPTELEESLGVNYSRMTVPGLSHQILQYVNTENVAFNFSLFWDATDLGIQGVEFILAARKFLYAACHPKATPGNIIGAGAPQILFLWPNMVSLMCVMTKLQFRYTRFNKFAEPTAYTASVTLEEVRTSLVSMEDVSSLGTLRGGFGSTIDLDQPDPTGD